LSLNPLKSGQGFYTINELYIGVDGNSLNPLKSGQGFYKSFVSSVTDELSNSLNPLKSGQGFYLQKIKKSILEWTEMSQSP